MTEQGSLVTKSWNPALNVGVSPREALNRVCRCLELPACRGVRVVVFGGRGERTVLYPGCCCRKQRPQRNLCKVMGWAGLGLELCGCGCGDATANLRPAVQAFFVTRPPLAPPPPNSLSPLPRSHVPRTSHHSILPCDLVQLDICLSVFLLCVTAADVSSYFPHPRSFLHTLIESSFPTRNLSMPSSKLLLPPGAWSL